MCKVRPKKYSKTDDLNNTVERRLSGLVGTWINSLDNQESENVNIDETIM